MRIDDASDYATLDELDDETLAVRAQRGSLASFDALVQRFDGRLYNFILRRVGNASDAEELTQETLLRAWKNIQRYRPTHRFSTWVFTIGARLSINHLRSARVRLAVNAEPQTVDESCPSSALDDAEMRRTLWDAVDETLTESQRAALWLRYAEDMSMQDIARILGKTNVGVRALLFRARTALAARLESEHPGPQARLTELPRACAVEVEA